MKHLKKILIAAPLALTASLLLAALGLAPSLASAQSTPTDGGPSACSTCESQIEAISATPFWSSYEEYVSRILTVDETVQNQGPGGSCHVRIASISVDNGVSIETPLPLDVGEVPSWGTGSVRIKFTVPPGVTRFRSRLLATCGPQPVEAPGRLAIQPAYAYANEGCPAGPVPDLSPRPLPEDQSYTPRRFVATLLNEDGSPAAGKKIDWSLSNPVQFRILDSSAITDENGQAFTLVTAPQYFVCIAPYFDRGATIVTATSEDGGSAEALFVYTRCAPLGTSPPWAGS